MKEKSHYPFIFFLSDNEAEKKWLIMLHKDLCKVMDDMRRIGLYPTSFIETLPCRHFIPKIIEFRKEIAEHLNQLSSEMSKREITINQYNRVNKISDDIELT